MGPFYSIDVECLATGYDHNARSVGQISLVDQHEKVLLDLYVKPDLPVVSYLTPLTSLTSEIINTHGIPLADAVRMLKAHLPRHSVLVGQNIRRDVEWLGLKEGVDFDSMQDLAGLYRVWNTKYNSWSIFGQDHLVKVLLGWDVENQGHNAALDAIKSMRLFNYRQILERDPSQWQQAQQALLSTPVAPSFAKRYPSFEGVCMGNRKSCTCGAPFFS